jgi:hypothetical protein
MVVAVAALAISSFGAASAVAATYHAESEGTTFTGSQKSKYKMATIVGTLTCSIGTYSGEMKGTSSEMLTVQPAYTGCTLLGLPMTVSAVSCKYTFTPPTRTEGIRWHWRVHDSCSGKSTIAEDSVAFGCVIEVPSQEGLEVMEGESIGPKSEIEATWLVTGVSYSYTSGCPNVTMSGTRSDGTRGGSIRFTGSSPIWIE